MVPSDGARKGLTAHFFFTFSVEVEEEADVQQEGSWGVRLLRTLSRGATEGPQRLLLQVDVEKRALVTVAREHVKSTVPASELASAGLVEGETQLVNIQPKMGKATSYAFQGPEDAACFLDVLHEVMEGTYSGIKSPRGVLRRGPLQKRGKSGVFFNRFVVLVPYKMFVMASRSSTYPTMAVSLVSAGVSFDNSTRTVFIKAGGRDWAFRDVSDENASAWFSAFQQAQQAPPTVPPNPTPHRTVTFSPETLQHAVSIAADGSPLGPRMFSLSPEALLELDAAVQAASQGSMKLSDIVRRSVKDLLLPAGFADDAAGLIKAAPGGKEISAEVEEEQIPLRVKYGVGQGEMGRGSEGVGGGSWRAAEGMEALAAEFVFEDAEGFGRGSPGVEPGFSAVAEPLRDNPPALGDPLNFPGCTPSEGTSGEMASWAVPSDSSNLAQTEFANGLNIVSEGSGENGARNSHASVRSNLEGGGERSGNQNPSIPLENLSSPFPGFFPTNQFGNPNPNACILQGLQGTPQTQPSPDCASPSTLHGVESAFCNSNTPGYATSATHMDPHGSALRDVGLQVSSSTVGRVGGHHAWVEDGGRSEGGREGGSASGEALPQHDAALASHIHGILERVRQVLAEVGSFSRTQSGMPALRHLETTGSSDIFQDMQDASFFPYAETPVHPGQSQTSLPPLFHQPAIVYQTQEAPPRLQEPWQVAGSLDGRSDPCESCRDVFPSRASSVSLCADPPGAHYWAGDDHPARPPLSAQALGASNVSRRTTGLSSLPGDWADMAPIDSRRTSVMPADAVWEWHMNDVFTPAEDAGATDAPTPHLAAPPRGVWGVPHAALGAAQAGRAGKLTGAGKVGGDSGADGDITVGSGFATYEDVLRLLTVGDAAKKVSHHRRRPHIHKRRVPHPARVPFHKRCPSPSPVRGPPPTQGALVPHTEHQPPALRATTGQFPLSETGGSLNITLNGSPCVSLSVLPGGQVLISLNGQDGKQPENVAENGARCSLADLNRQPLSSGIGQCTTAKGADAPPSLLTSTTPGLTNPCGNSMPASMCAGPVEDEATTTVLKDKASGAFGVLQDVGAQSRASQRCEATTGAGLLEYLAGLRKYIDSIGTPPDSGIVAAGTTSDPLPENNGTAGGPPEALTLMAGVARNDVAEGIPLPSQPLAVSGGIAVHGTAPETRDCLAGLDDTRAEPLASLRTRAFKSEDLEHFTPAVSKKIASAAMVAASTANAAVATALQAITPGRMHSSTFNTEQNMATSHVASMKAALTGTAPSTPSIYAGVSYAPDHSTPGPCRSDSANFPKNSLLAANAPYPDNTTDPCLQSVLRVLRDNGVRPLEGMPTLNEEAADSGIRDESAPRKTGAGDRCQGAGELSPRRSGIPLPGQIPRRPAAVPAVGPPARRTPVVTSSSPSLARHVDSGESQPPRHDPDGSSHPLQEPARLHDTKDAGVGFSWQPQAVQQAGQLVIQTPMPMGAQGPHMPMMMLAPNPQSWLPAQTVAQPYQMYPVNVNGYMQNTPMFSYPSMPVAAGGALPWAAAAAQGNIVPEQASPANSYLNREYAPAATGHGSIPPRALSGNQSVPHSLKGQTVGDVEHGRGRKPSLRASTLRQPDVKDFLHHHSDFTHHPCSVERQQLHEVRQPAATDRRMSQAGSGPANPILEAVQGREPLSCDDLTAGTVAANFWGIALRHYEGRYRT